MLQKCKNFDGLFRNRKGWLFFLIFKNSQVVVAHNQHWPDSCTLTYSLMDPLDSVDLQTSWYTWMVFCPMYCVTLTPTHDLGRWQLQITSWNSCSPYNALLEEKKMQKLLWEFLRLVYDRHIIISSPWNLQTHYIPQGKKIWYMG